MLVRSFDLVPQDPGRQGSRRTSPEVLVSRVGRLADQPTVTASSYDPAGAIAGDVAVS